MMKAKHLHILTFGTLGLVMHAAADVIYSNLQNIGIPATFDGLYLNVETGEWNTNMAAPVAGWDINPFFGGRSVANSPAFQPVRNGTESSSPIVNLAAGASVGSGSVFSTFVQGVDGETPGGPGYGGSQMLTGSGGNFTAGQEGYLGFRLNGTNYGSMRVVLTNNTSGAMIKDWAYDTSGAPVVVGAIQQVGQDIIFTSAFTLGSALTDSGGTTNLVKNGSGTNTLTATSTYTGATTVNAGKLLMGDAATDTFATSGVTVAPGATLGGSGTLLSGNLVLNAESATGVKDGGTLAPGKSPGILTTSGTTTFNTGSIFSWSIDTDSGSPGRGTEYAGLNTTSVSGTDAVFQIVTSDSEAFGDNFWETDHTWTDIFKSADGSASLADSWSAVFPSFAYANGSSTILAPTNGSFTWINSGKTLSWTAVPEPGSTLASLLLAAGLLRRRRMQS